MTVKTIVHEPSIPGTKSVKHPHGVPDLVKAKAGLVRKWLDKRVKVTSKTSEHFGLVVAVEASWHVGILEELKVKLDEGGSLLCSARFAELI